jgi:hypothetical protein
MNTAAAGTALGASSNTGDCPLDCRPSATPPQRSSSSTEYRGRSDRGALLHLWLASARPWSACLQRGIGVRSRSAGNRPLGRAPHANRKQLNISTRMANHAERQLGPPATNGAGAWALHPFALQQQAAEKSAGARSDALRLERSTRPLLCSARLVRSGVFHVLSPVVVDFSESPQALVHVAFHRARATLRPHLARVLDERIASPSQRGADPPRRCRTRHVE